MTRGTDSPAVIRTRSRIITARGRGRSVGLDGTDRLGVSRRAGGRASAGVVSTEAAGDADELAGHSADGFLLTSA